MKRTFLISVLLIVVVSSIYAQKKGFPRLSGPYLGQKAPGDVPEVFAPGIVSTQFHEHSFPTFSPDGKEIHWTVVIGLTGQSGESAKYFGINILSMKQRNGVWLSPEFFPFTTFYQELEGFFSPDGKKYFFASRRPFDKGQKESKGNHIWVSEKQGDHWKKPIPLPPPIRTEKPASSPTVTNTETIYFESVWEKGEYEVGIFRSELINGKYSDPQLLPGSINTPHLDWTPFISSDESYLLFASNRPGGYGSTDIYVAFRNKDGLWTESYNLGPSINSEFEEGYPYVSPDGKYLFFVANKFLFEDVLDDDYTYGRVLDVLNRPGNGANDIYWVDAKIIDRLRPKE